MKRRKLTPIQAAHASAREGYLERRLERRRRLLTDADAVPAKGQHEQPCSDCPWSRQALPGWLGSLSADEWVEAVHGEVRIECHALKGAQCAGSAIYRANVCKRPRDPETLLLKADRSTVFATPQEFREYHGRGNPRQRA